MQTLPKKEYLGKPQTAGETKTKTFKESEPSGNVQKQKTLNTAIHS